MRIGHYVSVVAGQKGFENNVSGHIQVPMKAMELLRDAGHEVHLITNAFGPERSLPDCLPRDVPVHYVADGRRRGGVLERTGSHAQGIHPMRTLRQMRQIVSIARETDLDVLHSYGVNRSAQLPGVLRMLGLKIPSVGTLATAQFPERLPKPLSRALWKRVGAVLTATNYVRDLCARHGVTTRIVRHGVIRDLRAELGDDRPGERNRVLFWRDPTRENGADVVMRVYEALASRHPSVRFTMAVRPHWAEIPGIDAWAERFDNVEVLRFPYEKDVTLPKLMFESLCVLMPIREMSIQPQLVIAESMAVGVPVLATDKGSTPELFEHGRSGMLFPEGDAEAATSMLDGFLGDRSAAEAMGEAAEKTLRRSWNWDRYVEDVTAVYRELGVR
ncbi:MAG: glycosyltransferase family 4 protein [Planctomycetes bacterium]|nr:glycosyltransferase family 4 protein [Planctomycetota bacterium]